MVGQRQQALTIRFRQQQNRSDTKLANVFASTLPIQKGSGACPLRLRSIVTLELDRIVVVPDRKPDPTDQLRQGIPRRQSHIDGASGIDREPTGGLSDGEETAHALDPPGRTDVAPRTLCATQRRTGQIHPVVTLRIIAGAGGGGMNPQVLSGPDLSTVPHGAIWTPSFGGWVLFNQSYPRTDGCGLGRIPRRHLP
jgi:hypothetical protein